MKLNKGEKQYPILLAFEHKKTGFLSVWCPYCCTFHFHGEGEGHRSAHCTNPNSPFKESGYVIKKGTNIELDIVTGEKRTLH